MIIVDVNAVNALENVDVRLRNKLQWNTICRCCWVYDGLQMRREINMNLYKETKHIFSSNYRHKLAHHLTFWNWNQTTLYIYVGKYSKIEARLTSEQQQHQ